MKSCFWAYHDVYRSLRAQGFVSGGHVWRGDRPEARPVANVPRGRAGQEVDFLVVATHQLLIMGRMVNEGGLGLPCQASGPSALCRLGPSTEPFGASVTTVKNGAKDLSAA